MTSSILDTVRQMITERLYLEVPPEELHPEASLTVDFGVDSVSLLELIVGLEEVFGIRMSEEDFELAHFNTPASLARFVESKLPQESQS